MTMTSPDGRRLSQIRPLPDPAGSQPSSPASVLAPRTLPEPGPASAPNTSEPIAPNSFYGKPASNREPPPLPARPSISPPAAEGLGSKSTVYIPPESDPAPSSPFRSPVLVPDSPPAQPTPPLLRPVTDSDWSNNKSGISQWTENWTVAPNDISTSWMKDTDDWRTAEAAKWTATWGTTSYGFKINGRDEAEEQVWWDPMARDAFGRPGPGILPTCAIDFIMQKSDTLYSVQGHLPNAAELTRGQQPAHPITDAPTEDEVRMAMPHPNAFFSTKEFGWMIILWRESSQPPPIFPGAYLPSPLPDAGRRKATKPCGPDGENLTHHFHSISDIIDASKIDPPYLRAPWHDQPEKSEEFNALMCCQCPLWGVFSYTLSSVIPKEVMDMLVEERAQSPSPGQSPFDAVYTALSTIHMFAVSFSLTRISLIYTHFYNLQRHPEPTLEGRGT
jgi:ubiquitin carboxyl-terminal hydrolase 25